ncbi:hypothetical protein [Arthrobacter sp. 'calajunan']|uniref:hypothetical protein n=1 Tax=Arthrobacter sp. 'calajunan' TaxID=1690248 RepID=UPI003C72921C
MDEIIQRGYAGDQPQANKKSKTLGIAEGFCVAEQCEPTQSMMRSACRARMRGFGGILPKRRAVTACRASEVSLP